MKRLPTDLKLLDTIYRTYYDAFASYSDKSPNRSSKIYVPIDIEHIARQFNLDGDIIFGRLYYHLDEKYRYVQPGGAEVHLFSVVVGGDHHCVNFPYVASLVASLREQDRKFRIATGMAMTSLLVSLVSFVLSLAR
jgi:hypothetical protein